MMKSIMFVAVVQLLFQMLTALFFYADYLVEHWLALPTFVNPLYRFEQKKRDPIFLFKYHSCIECDFANMRKSSLPVWTKKNPIFLFKYHSCIECDFANMRKSSLPVWTKKKEIQFSCSSIWTEKKRLNVVVQIWFLYFRLFKFRWKHFWFNKRVFKKESELYYERKKIQVNKWNRNRTNETETWQSTYNKCIISSKKCQLPLSISSKTLSSFFFPPDH